MEALSGVASGMAVASLTIQLIDSIVIIKAFIRKVKDTPKELDRLIQLLERLGALLEDVRNMIERQTSLQGNQFPLPPNSIFMWLKGCESTLKPLEDIVRKETLLRQNKQSKLRLDVKFALKAKEIGAWEEAIQHDIQYLNSAMLVNQTTILLQAPAILASNSLSLTTPNGLSTQSTSVVTCKTSSSDELVHTHNTVAWRSRTSWMPTQLERLGVQLQRSSRSLVVVPQKFAPSIQDSECIIEEDTYYWISQWLRRGISWRIRRPYGPILPSLTTYPIIDWFPDDLPASLETATVMDVQKWFSTNTVHPHTRDHSGRSLLHEAAHYHRNDICQFLVQYGVKSDICGRSHSPLFTAIDSLWQLGLGTIETNNNVVDTFRALLHAAKDTEDFRYDSRLTFAAHFKVRVSDALWLLKYSSDVLCREDYLNLERFLYHQSLLNTAFGRYSPWSVDIARPGVTISAPLFERHKPSAELQAGLERGLHHLLYAYFYADVNSSDSFNRGRVLLEVLAHTSINMELFMVNEMENMRTRQPYSWGPCEKKIIIGGSENDTYRLGWEWNHDAAAEGYLVVSELPTFTSGIVSPYVWPFQNHVACLQHATFFCRECQALRNARSQRRQLKRAKKALHSRRKQGLDIMPGTWR